MPDPRTITLELLGWWTRHHLPFRRALLRAAGVWDHDRWKHAPVRVCRGAWHGYRIRCDLADYHQRAVFLFRRLMDLPTQLFLLEALRPAETGLDIGANVGLTAMIAAHAVGPRGRVLAFEPNPDALDILHWHIRENRLTQIHVVGAALGDRDATLRLAVPPTGNTGAGSLGPLPERHGGRTSAEHLVPVRRGDDLLPSLLADDPDTPTVIKIDVEGYETHALRGLSRTILARRPAIIAEVNRLMLPACGSSEDELFALIDAWGYRTFRPVAVRSRLGRERLELRDVGNRWRPVRRAGNAVFLHPRGPHWPRLQPLMCPPKPPPAPLHQRLRRRLRATLRPA